LWVGFSVVKFNAVRDFDSRLRACRIVDQYRLEEDEEGNIISDPNDPQDEQYIVQLIQRVTSVSLETRKLIRQLPEKLEFSAPNAGRKTPLSVG
jgi:hypothetical protein